MPAYVESWKWKHGYAAQFFENNQHCHDEVYCKSLIFSEHLILVYSPLNQSSCDTVNIHFLARTWFSRFKTTLVHIFAFLMWARKYKPFLFPQKYESRKNKTSAKLRKTRKKKKKSKKKGEKRKNRGESIKIFSRGPYFCGFIFSRGPYFRVFNFRVLENPRKFIWNVIIGTAR